MNKTSTAVLILTSTLLFACGQQEAATEPAPVASEGGNESALQAAEQIESEYMREIIKEISQDSYEGRGPGSRGDAKARTYLAGRLAELGLEPAAADGSWEQPFDLVGVNSAQPDEWVFEGASDSLTLKQWEQFIVGSGIQEESAGLTDAESDKQHHRDFYHRQ